MAQWRPLNESGTPFNKCVQAGVLAAAYLEAKQQEGYETAQKLKVKFCPQNMTEANLLTSLQIAQNQANRAQKSPESSAPVVIAESRYLDAVANHADRAIVCGTLNDAIQASLIASDQHAWSLLKAQKAQQYCD